MVQLMIIGIRIIGNIILIPTILDPILKSLCSGVGIAIIILMVYLTISKFRVLRAEAYHTHSLKP